MSVVGKPLNNYQTCIDACLRCFQACHECAVLCMREPDVAQRTAHIAMMMECASICKEAACLMTMNAKHVKAICTVCATVCEECAAGCALSIVSNARISVKNVQPNARLCKTVNRMSKIHLIA